MTTTTQGEEAEMFGLKSKTAEPVAAPIPAGLGPLSQECRKKVRRFVEALQPGFRDVVKDWAFYPNGRPIGPLANVNDGRDRPEERLAPNQYFVLRLVEPACVPPAGLPAGFTSPYVERVGPTVEEQAEAQMDEWFTDGGVCWRRGSPLPVVARVEVPPAVPVRGLDVGVPVSPQMVQAIVRCQYLDQARRDEGRPVSRQLVPISTAYHPLTGAHRLVSELEKEKQDLRKWILTNSLQVITSATLEPYRIGPDGIVHILPPDAG
jgi:hypothetical protein